jgi:hypothetical protein
VWERTVDGRKLNFHLAGINNQNFIMRDEETGSWWQQASGEAILGPLQGRRLNQVLHDEVSFSIWKREQPGGRVLRPEERFAGKYAPADWEDHVAKLPVVSPKSSDDELAPRDLIVGIAIGGASKAYPMSKLERESPVIDTLGGVPIMIVFNEKSVRAFERAVDDRVLEFFSRAGASPLRLVDAETGSEWDFAGSCISGPLAGRQLKKIATLSDYWFDWKSYHPDSVIY